MRSLGSTASGFFSLKVPLCLQCVTLNPFGEFCQAGRAGELLSEVFLDLQGVSLGIATYWVRWHLVNGSQVWRIQPQSDL